MRHWSSGRWRGNFKTALASTIAAAHERGMTAPLARGRNRPLVLGYHRVIDDFESVARTEMPSMLISTEMFERHLDYIGRHFRFASLDEIGEQMLSGRPFEEPVAAVTFDDGYADVYEHAYPVLKRKGIPAAVFVVTDLVGQPVWQVHDHLYHVICRAFATSADPGRDLRDLMTGLGLPTEPMFQARDATQTPLLAVSAILPALSMADVRRVISSLEARVGRSVHAVPQTIGWAALADMCRGGITIGSHTKNHVSLPAESPADMAEELEGSKRELESHLGQPVTHFAYPGGQFSPPVIDAVARAGFRFVYTACQHTSPQHPALTIDRLLLWEGSSVDADGRFSPAILNCQAQDLWLPSRRCVRVHGPEQGQAHG